MLIKGYKVVVMQDDFSLRGQMYSKATIVDNNTVLNTGNLFRD